jgi:hypothetical protein
MEGVTNNLMCRKEGIGFVGKLQWMRSKSSTNGLDTLRVEGKKNREIAFLADKLINHEVAPVPRDSIIHKLQKQ